MYLRSMMWKYDCPHIVEQMVRECQQYKWIIFHEWKLSPSLTYYYSEDKYFDSYDKLADWIIEEFADLFEEVICGNCERPYID